MFRTHRSAFAVPATVLLLALSGCSLDIISGDNDELTGAAACALGHSWSADLTDTAAQLLPELQDVNGNVTEVVATGEQVLEWSLEHTAVVTTDYVLTITLTNSDDVVSTVEQTRSGVGKGGLTVHETTAVPSDWEADYSRSTTVDGEAVEEPPFAILDPTFDDTVALEITCDGGVLTTLAHGAVVTQKWNRVG